MTRKHKTNMAKIQAEQTALEVAQQKLAGMITSVNEYINQLKVEELQLNAALANQAVSKSVGSDSILTPVSTSAASVLQTANLDLLVFNQLCEESKPVTIQGSNISSVEKLDSDSQKRQPALEAHETNQNDINCINEQRLDLSIQYKMCASEEDDSVSEDL